MDRDDLVYIGLNEILLAGTEDDPFPSSMSPNLVIRFQQVCLEICDHLNIELFRIPYPPRLPTNPVPLIVGNAKQGTTAQTAPSNNTSDRNGLSATTAKRQTRSSKRH